MYYYWDGMFRQDEGEFRGLWHRFRIFMCPVLHMPKHQDVGPAGILDNLYESREPPDMRL